MQNWTTFDFSAIPGLYCCSQHNLIGGQCDANNDKKGFCRPNRGDDAVQTRCRQNGGSGIFILTRDSRSSTILMNGNESGKMFGCEDLGIQWGRGKDRPLRLRFVAERGYGNYADISRATRLVRTTRR